MPTPPIRTITLGLDEAHPISGATIHRVAAILERAKSRFTAAGYEVQTVRLSTRPILRDLISWQPAQILHYTQQLQRALDGAGLAYCSLGPLDPGEPGLLSDHYDLIADIVVANNALNATVQFGRLYTNAALPTAQIIQRLAQETDEGFGNFRFAMLAGVEPGGPFFPAAYHAGPSSLAVGLQGASIITEALRTQRSEATLPLDPIMITQRIREALIIHTRPVIELAEALSLEHELQFGGIDLSPAPMGDDSITTALELCGYGVIGVPGTLTASAALTGALKSTGLLTCGYNGLMLPVLEDAVLGRRWEEGTIDVYKLLLYSSVCGTGLDTVPLPGDISAQAIAQLLLDVATMALRLNKPLSARLFPVPGKRAGERTAFSSPYLTNTLIREMKH